MEPNWFYSSLAQSAAAIVGIVSVLLFSKIQDIKKDASKSEIKFYRKIKNLEQKRTEISSKILDFGPYTPERPKVPWDDIPNFGLYYNIKELLNDKKKFNDFEKKMTEFDEAEYKLYFLETDSTGEYAPHYDYHFNEDEKICKDIGIWWKKTKDLINEIKMYNKMLKPSHYINIIILLEIIFMTCIILPLLQLDFNQIYYFKIISDKIIYIIFFFFGFTGLLFEIYRDIKKIQIDFEI